MPRSAASKHRHLNLLDASPTPQGMPAAPCKLLCRGSCVPLYQRSAVRCCAWLPSSPRTHNQAHPTSPMFAAQHGTAWHSVAQHGTAWRGQARTGQDRAGQGRTGQHSIARQIKVQNRAAQTGQGRQHSVRNSCAKDLHRMMCAHCCSSTACLGKQPYHSACI
jgi:hypothetical protein